MNKSDTTPNPDNIRPGFKVRARVTHVGDEKLNGPEGPGERPEPSPGPDLRNYTLTFVPATGHMIIRAGSMTGSDGDTVPAGEIEFIGLDELAAFLPHVQESMMKYVVERVAAGVQELLGGMEAKVPESWKN